MVPAALGLVVFSAALLAAAATAANPAGSRSAPTRPGLSASEIGPQDPNAAAARLPTKRLAGIDYVSVAEIARRLDLKLAWTVKGRKLALSSPTTKAVLELDAREAEINDLRVFLGEPVRGSSGQLHVSRADFEACLAPLLHPGWGARAVPAAKFIVLDPGHGGRDNGTSVHEKNFALDVARRARKALEASGYRVALTREEDVFMALAQRSAFAAAARADLFVSIHFNALINDTRTSGVEVYTFPPPGLRSTNSWNALRESDAEPNASPANRNDHWNAVLAGALHRRLVKDLGATDRGKKLMHLGVLRGLPCPGVLVECGFLTSAVEARKIESAAYRQQIAEVLAAGIGDYSRTLARVGRP